MQKQLITIDNLDEFICSSSKKFYMDAGKILTPGAKDELCKRGIRIEFNDSIAAPQAKNATSCDGICENDVDEALIAVAATLKKEYGVSDPQQLKALSIEVLKTLKENISIF